MSAWSSSTGKAQLSYADRLRQASKSNAPSAQDSSSPSASRDAPRDGAKATLSSASLTSAGSPLKNVSSASSANAATASASAPGTSLASSESKAASPSQQEAASKAPSGSGSTVNVWETRRKQIAEREAEKERERQATLAQQSKAGQAVTGAAPTPAGTAANKSRQAGTGPRKGNERHSKGSTSSNQSDRKSSKQATPASDRSSSTVPIVSSKSDKANAAPTASNASTASSISKKADTNSLSAEQGRVKATTAQQTTSAQSGDEPGSQHKIQEVDVANDGSKVPSQTSNPVADAPAAAQRAAAQLPPSSALSVQTAPTPSVAHDDIPASPATVASAIEEVLKNGGTNGSQTEDDDAWLARIHLLNGGQNMPKFGGFGANGASGHSDEAEQQAAKKAERAVAAAWGAGKNVWNKSQQHTQQPKRADAGKDASGASSSTDATKDGASQGNDSRSTQATKDGKQASSSAPVTVNGTHSHSSEADSVAATQGQKTAAGQGLDNAGIGSDSAKKATKAKMPAATESRRNAKGASPQSTGPTPNVPPFEDVNNWPSPLDAGKKVGEKAKAATGSSEHDNADTSKQQTQPKPQKSLYETLDELQVRLAPGVNGHQQGAAGGAKKGKQQWVPILPDITHASTPASGNKPSRPASDAKQSKGANKQQQQQQQPHQHQQQQQQQQQQQRKDGNKGAGQTQQAAQGGKKDAVAKSKDKSQAKDGSATMAADAKASSETRGKNDMSSQADKVGTSAQAEVDTQPEILSTPAVPAQPAKISSQSQREDASQGSAKGTESGPAGSEHQKLSKAASSRDDSPTKQSQQTRTHLRPGPNGVSSSPYPPRPNGVGLPRSGASSGTGTPITTNRNSPRGSVVSSPQVHALPRVAGALPTDALSQPPPIFYGPSGAATPMHLPGPPVPAPWLPYTSYARSPSYMFDATPQTGAPFPTGVLGQLLTQIEFYFSQQNLQGDFFLRQKMDAQGWVDIAVVAGFKRVQGITRDVAMVKDALLWSAVLDVDAEAMKVRRRFGWELYTLATAAVEDPEKAGEAEEEEALGVVAASGFGGRLLDG